MRTIMTTIAPLLLATAACGTAAPPARAVLVPGAAQDAIAPPAQTGASRPLALHAFRASVDGAIRDVLLVRDPSDGTYWWTVQKRTDPDAPLGAFPGGGNVVYAGNGRIAVVVPSSWIHFSIISSARRARSLEDAKTAILGELERNVDGAVQTFVDLTPHVGRDFGTVPGMATHRPLSIESIAFDGNRWTVSVKGLSGDTATVTLSDDHRILSVTRGQS
jgi:hypothetical protein